MALTQSILDLFLQLCERVAASSFEDKIQDARQYFGSRHYTCKSDARMKMLKCRLYEKLFQCLPGPLSVPSMNDVVMCNISLRISV